MSENAEKPPKTAALRGAVFAFSPQDQLSNGSLKSKTTGARTAALLATSNRSKPSSTPAIDFPTKHVESVGPTTPRSSVKNQIHRLERSDAEFEAKRNSHSGQNVRPSFARSSSHIAARLANTKLGSNTNIEERSASLSPAHVSVDGGGLSINRDGSRSPRDSSKVHLQTSPDAPESLTKEPKHIPSVSSKPTTSLSPQARHAADIAVRAAAVSKQDQQGTPRRISNLAVESPLTRRLSLSSTQSDINVQDTRKKQAPLPPKKPGPLRPRSKSQPRRPSHSTPVPSLLRDLRTGLTASNLADAMVASSLASSRAPSPAKTSSAPPPPPKRRRHSRSYSQDLFHAGSLSLLAPHPAQSHQRSFYKSKSTSSSPGHPTTATHSLRTTLRSQDVSSSSDNDASRRGRRHLVRKHPHKHHEGSRQRWRPTITSTERRRYEGVWAANRGLLLPPQLAERVCNLVVRELWERSGLGSEVLQDTWDLVSGEGKAQVSERSGRYGNKREDEGEWRKSLGKREFVVGMWLIDQSLKGRKLPAIVGSQVWESARGVAGVTVKGIG